MPKVEQADREAEEFVPCPVCGSQPRWRGTRSDYARGIYRLQCIEGTHLFQAYGPSAEACIANWNTRHREAATRDLAGEVERLVPVLLAWKPEPDDRTRSLLLAEATKRGAAEWSFKDAENVIAFLLARAALAPVKGEDHG